MRVNNNRTSVLLCFLIALFLIPKLDYAQSKPNRQVLAELLTSPILNSLDSIMVKPIPLRIVIKQNSELALWLKSELRSDLLVNNFQVYEAPLDSTQNNPAESEIIIVKVEAQIKYKSADRNLLFRTTKYKRMISGILNYYIKSKTGAVLVSQNKTLSYNDIVGKSEMDKIENKAFLFTVGTKTESKFIKRLFEPVIVTITTAGVVYLFYTLRSS
jgi:biopolymer transport protein ExbD